MAVGWFGIPGQTGGVTHIVHDGKPACGTPIDRRSEFQWCCHDDLTYVPECQRCLPIYRQILIKLQALCATAITRSSSARRP